MKTLPNLLSKIFSLKSSLPLLNTRLTIKKIRKRNHLGKTCDQCIKILEVSVSLESQLSKVKDMPNKIKIKCIKTPKLLLFKTQVYWCSFLWWPPHKTLKWKWISIQWRTGQTILSHSMKNVKRDFWSIYIAERDKELKEIQRNLCNYQKRLNILTILMN